MEYCLWESDIVSQLRPPKASRILANKRYVRVAIFSELEEEEPAAENDAV